MTLSVGILMFPDVQQLDLTGPYEVFASAPGCKVHLVAKTRDPIISATSLVLLPTVTFADCPSLDVLCVPGGSGVNALLTDAETLAFVRDKARAARFVTSVCTGALVLGAAGLLRGKRAATHWAAMEFLEKFGATAVPERVVRDGALITAGGVTAGIDFALTIVAEVYGRELAETIQLAMEYAPAPPFDAGTPETAAPERVETVKAWFAATRQVRERIVDQVTKGEAS